MLIIVSIISVFKMDPDEKEFVFPIFGNKRKGPTRASSSGGIWGVLAGMWVTVLSFLII